MQYSVTARSFWFRTALAAAVGGALGLSGASGQVVVPEKKKTPSKTVTSQPKNAPAGTNNQNGAATPPTPSGPPIEPGPYITRLSPKDWTLEVRLRVMSRRPDKRDQNNMPMDQTFEFSKVAVVFPALLTSSSHVLNQKMISGELRIGDNLVYELDPNQKIMMGNVFHSGTNLIKFEYSAPGPDLAKTPEIQMLLSLPTTCYQTKFDETEAMKVGWPKGEWPAIAKSTFQPQMCIDMDGSAPYDMQDVKAAVKRWLSAAGVNDPKSVPPVRLAKIITGGVVGDIQPSGDGYATARTGEFEGFEVRSPAVVLNEHRGNEVEMVSLLVLSMRQAGLPARIVMGQEAVEGGDRNRVFLSQRSGGKQLRVWAEFCLFDEVKNTVNWVPIDVIRIRKVSSRPPGLDREWRFFGTDDELNAIVPFSFTFHPPLPAVRAYGAPACYGLITEPPAPATAYQMLEFSTSRMSKTADKDPKTPDKTKSHEVKRGKS